MKDKELRAALKRVGAIEENEFGSLIKSGFNERINTLMIGRSRAEYNVECLLNEVKCLQAEIAGLKKYLSIKEVEGVVFKEVLRNE